VLEDYLLTRQFFDRSCELILTQGGAPLFDAVDRAVWEPLMQVHPEYLRAMFAAVESAHGSVEGYLHERLGIDAQRLNEMRAHLLE
jgi:hypothetical protein